MIEDSRPSAVLRGASFGAPRRVGFGFLDLNDGGAQRLTLVACKHLRPDRFLPTVICARGKGSLVEEARSAGVDVRTLGRLQRPFDLASVAVMARTLRELSVEILHVPLYSRASPYFRLAARLARVDVVVAQDWSQPAASPLLRRWADALLAGGTRYVAASGAQRQNLLAKGVHESSIAVVHAGIERDRFGLESRSEARRRLGLQESAKIVLVVARLEPVKGHQDLLETLPGIVAQEPGLLVLCAGQGGLLERLKSRAAAMGMGENLRFLGQRQDIARLLSAADLLVLPSRDEGLPSAILEAYAAGRAVVATAVGGVAEALADGVEGRLVPARDREALAGAILELLADPERRAAMGERGLQTVARRFDAVKSTRLLEEVYEAWLASAPRRRDATA